MSLCGGHDGFFPAASLGASQGRYDNILAVDPADANTVYLGGDLTYDGDYCLSLYKGTLTGEPGSYTFPFNRANDIYVNPSASPIPAGCRWIPPGLGGASMPMDMPWLLPPTRMGRTMERSSRWAQTAASSNLPRAGPQARSFPAISAWPSRR